MAGFVHCWSVADLGGDETVTFATRQITLRQEIQRAAPLVGWTPFQAAILKFAVQ
jgi:hypothetical protein